MNVPIKWIMYLQTHAHELKSQKGVKKKKILCVVGT